MLSDVIHLLQDPSESSHGVTLRGNEDWTALISEHGREYPISKEGYVILSDGELPAGDDEKMVEARDIFLANGHFAPFVEAVTRSVGEAVNDADIPVTQEVALCEAGAGTGYYLSHTLDSVDQSVGVAIDVSLPAAEKLAQCHPRVGAVVADALRTLPLLNESVDVISAIFAPRNPAEFARVLKDGGELVVLTSHEGHLGELRAPLEIPDVRPHKVEEIIDQVAEFFEAIDAPQLVEFPMTLDHDSILAQIAMSPSAQVIDQDELARRASRLPDTMTVTARSTITRLQKK